MPPLYEQDASRPNEAVLEQFHGQPVARHYGDWQAEYRAMTDGVGAAHDVAHGFLEVTGSDRGSFLNRLATNKLDNLAPGAGRETFLTDARGHILAFVQVFARSDSLLLRLPLDQIDKVAGHLDRYLIRENVVLNARDRDLTAVLLAGPRAAEVVRSVASASIPKAYLQSAETIMGGVPVWIHTLRAEPPEAVLLSVALDSLTGVWQELRAAGAVACGRQASEVFRIEAGWPRYGQDITEENLPQEVARDGLAISFTKGCYLGQETVARIDSRGHVNRLLTGLVFPGDVAVPSETELTAAGAVVGRVTSSAWSPRVAAGVALGYVRRAHHAREMPVDSAFGSGKVVGLPMFS